MIDYDCLILVTVGVHVENSLHVTHTRQLPLQPVEQYLIITQHRRAVPRRALR